MKKCNKLKQAPDSMRISRGCEMGKRIVSSALHGREANMATPVCPQYKYKEMSSRG